MENLNVHYEHHVISKSGALNCLGVGGPAAVLVTRKHYDAILPKRDYDRPYVHTKISTTVLLKNSFAMAKLH